MMNDIFCLVLHLPVHRVSQTTNSVHYRRRDRQHTYAHLPHTTLSFSSTDGTLTETRRNSRAKQTCIAHRSLRAHPRRARRDASLVNQAETRRVGGRGVSSQCATGFYFRHADLMVSVRPGPCKLSLVSPTTVMAVVAVTTPRRAFCIPAVFPSAPSSNGA